MFHDIFMAILWLCIGGGAVISIAGGICAFHVGRALVLSMWDAFKVPKAG